jgi:hypothetical protein
LGVGNYLLIVVIYATSKLTRFLDLGICATVLGGLKLEVKVCVFVCVCWGVSVDLKRIHVGTKRRLLQRNASIADTKPLLSSSGI